MSAERQQAIAEARAAFLADDVVLPGVRDATLRAWHRSKAAGAPAAPGYVPAVGDKQEGDSALLRAVSPVINGLMRQFDGTDVAMMVADREARIVGRRLSGNTIARHLERRGVVCGAAFDEARVGSTGLGSVLEDGATVVVEGTEHFNEAFDSVVAVGAPIVHPATGAVEGVVDVVCPVGAPVQFILPLVARAARDAGEQLVSGYAQEDRALLDAFLQRERRGPRRPMVALNGRMLFANARGGELLASRPHAELWEQVQGALADAAETTVLSASEDGLLVVARVREVRSPGGRLGAILQLSSDGERCRSRHGARSAGLRRTLEAAGERSTGSVVGAGDLPVDGTRGKGLPRGRLTYLEIVERDAIAALLDASGGSKTEVARRLGISRSTLYRKLSSLGLEGY
jgi:transcriptional regulator of acetoin/glycerol metabolism